MVKGRNLITVLLTVNALLLAAMLWLQVAERPLLAGPAVAQNRSLPNSGAQREQMIALLHGIGRSVEETKNMLKKGPVRVSVVPGTATKKAPPSAPRR